MEQICATEDPNKKEELRKELTTLDQTLADASKLEEAILQRPEITKPTGADPSVLGKRPHYHAFNHDSNHTDDSGMDSIGLSAL